MIHKIVTSSLALQEAVAEKPIRFIRSPGQKPVTAACLATRLNLQKKGIKPLAIECSHCVRFSIEMAGASLGFNKPRGSQRGQLKFFGVDDMKKNNVESRPAKQIYPLPKLVRVIQKITKDNQNTAAFSTRKNLFQTRAKVRLTLGARLTKRIKDSI